MAVAVVNVIAGLVGLAKRQWENLDPAVKRKIAKAIREGQLKYAKALAAQQKKLLKLQRQGKLPFAHSAPEYPECSGKEGMGMVRCLIRNIKRDNLSKSMKVKRIAYLVALNKRAKWAGMTEVRAAVERALAPLRKHEKNNPCPRGRRKQRSDAWL